jgi:hypothetical protein
MIGAGPQASTVSQIVRRIDRCPHITLKRAPHFFQGIAWAVGNPKHQNVERQ